MPLIDLKAPRVIVIDDRSQKYKFTIERIPKRSWLTYFENVVSVSENQNGKRLDSFDSSGARLQLVAEVLIGAEGYELPKDCESITDLNDWPNQLPLSHRLGVASVLVSAGARSQDATGPLKLGCESVSLDAIWGADAEGKMFKLSGLRHDFETPSAEQQSRFSRDSSRSLIVGGSRTGKTRWLGAQATLAALYDELIVSVDGYGIDGQPFKDGDRDSIVEYMDTYHKVVAADSLFSPAIPKIEEGNG